MKVFIDRSIVEVDRYFSSTYTNIPKPKKYWYIQTGTSTQTECVNALGQHQPANDTDYFYCATDDSIYLGQNQIWDFYRRFGAIGPIVGLAHEWGHHVQMVANVPSPTTNAETLNHENQADCVAGAWTDWADERPGRH
jgi:predicted metalloprotease